MKTKILAGLILVSFLTAAGFASLKTTIIYETHPLSVDPNGPARWQYTYDVTNINLTRPIVEFTIWFDYGLYDNLSIETADPRAGDWDEIVIQPEPVLKDDGYYDAKTGVWKRGIGIGQTVSDFSVSFDWLGVGQPGSQLYDIIDPLTLETIDSGQTIPEPATLLLLGLGTLGLRRKRWPRIQ